LAALFFHAARDYFSLMSTRDDSPSAQAPPRRSGLARFIATCIALVLLIAFGYPFAQDAYHRYQVSRRLDAVMDSNDRAAFRQWNGDAASFAKALFERCELTNGRGAVQCERYRYAFSDR